MEVFLTTSRLVLRHFTSDDADNLVELDGDPEVMRFINGGKPMEKAGLKFVRTFYYPWPDIIEGSEHGDVEYAIARSDSPDRY